jgi:hypothetical protein
LKGILSLHHQKGILDVPDTALIVGIDETGCEDYLDKNNPVFGLGGCAVLARDYFQFLDDPWKDLKDRHFGGQQNKLQATDDNTPTLEQLNALEHFFTKLPFFRFACMSAKTMKNETVESNIQLLVHSIMSQVCEFATKVQPTEMVFIIEESARIEKELLKYFRTYRVGNGDIDMIPTVLIASKEVKASCVEVADFVVHPAGAQVRNRLRGFNKNSNIIRKDFATVFHKVDSRLCSYREILSAKPSIMNTK